MAPVMVRVLSLSVIDCGVKPKTNWHLFFFSANHAGVSQAKIGWLGFRIMCPSGVTCLPVDCCFSEPVL
jgi:hypothetical protein